MGAQGWEFRAESPRRGGRGGALSRVTASVPLPRPSLCDGPAPARRGSCRSRRGPGLSAAGLSAAHSAVRPAPHKATGRGCGMLRGGARTRAGRARCRGGMLGPGHPARAWGPDVPACRPRSPCQPPPPPDLRHPACPARCPPGTPEGKDTAQALGLCVQGSGSECPRQGACGLCRAGHRHRSWVVPARAWAGPRPTRAAGPQASICQTGVGFALWFPVSALQQNERWRPGCEFFSKPVRPLNAGASSGRCARQSKQLATPGSSPSLKQNPASGRQGRGAGRAEWQGRLPDPGRGLQ